MKYYCQACKQTFEADEQRCPECLKRSSVVPNAGTRPAGKQRAAPPSLLQGPGLLVTIVILTPLMTLNFMEWRLGWWFTFIAAMIGFGAGHLVNWWWRQRKGD